MYFGLASLPTYSFVGIGFWVVMAAGLGLGTTFPIGKSRGRRAATRWINGCLLILVLGGAVDVALAAVSGQWQRFMLQFGFGPLAEMAVLATLFVGTMWWMAMRYTAGLDS